MKPSRFLKNFLKSETTQNAACWLIAQYLRFVYLTSRWEFIGFESQSKCFGDDRPVMILLWHGRIAMTAYAWDCKKHPISVLASGHKDGKFVSKTLAHFGVDSISGSSKKGAVSATKNVVRSMKQGRAIAMSPDGPRGPRMRMKDGPIVIQRLTNGRITFITYAVKRRIKLSSWDSFIIPLPFTRGVFIWSDEEDLGPAFMESDAEDKRKTLEAKLTELTWLADEMMGHERILPTDKEKEKRK